MSTVRSVVRSASSRRFSLKSLGSVKSSPGRIVGGGHGPHGPGSTTTSTTRWRLPDSIHHGQPSEPSRSYSIIEIPDDAVELPHRTKDKSSALLLEWKQLHLSHAKLAGVADVAFVLAEFSCFMYAEMPISEGVDPMLLTVFTTVVALNLLSTITASLIAKCILPEMEAIVEQYPYGEPSEGPHSHLKPCIYLAWVLVNTVSIFLFTLGCILICWVKFARTSIIAAWCGTAILFPVLLGICMFAILVYRSLNKHQVLLYEKQYRELKLMCKQLNVTRV